MGELKKLADDRSALLEEAEQSKKKLSRDIETLQGRVDELSANNSKLEKTRKRLQDEVRFTSFKKSYSLSDYLWLGNCAQESS